MKKSLLTASIIAIGALGLVAPAMSEDNIFGNLDAKAPATTDLSNATTVKVDQPIVVRGASQMNQDESLTTQSLQSSISSIESAQNELRAKLETAQSNFNVADQEFKRVKQERAALRKIVRQTNSRIKSLERTKKRVQKTIQSNI